VRRRDNLDQRVLGLVDGAVLDCRAERVCQVAHAECGTEREGGTENRQRDRQGVQTREDVCVVWCVCCSAVRVCVGWAGGVRIAIACEMDGGKNRVGHPRRNYVWGPRDLPDASPRRSSGSEARRLQLTRCIGIDMELDLVSDFGTVCK
jgi:hypothetical protein